MREKGRCTPLDTVPCSRQIFWTTLLIGILRSAVGMTHTLRSDLWWTIPFRLLLGQFWVTPRIPHDQASPSQTHRCPGVSGSYPTCGCTWVVLWLLFSGPLPLRSLILGPLSRVHFGESLVVRLYSEIDHTYLSIEAQCVSHHYSRWTAHRRQLCVKQMHAAVNYFHANPFPLVPGIDDSINVPAFSLN